MVDVARRTSMTTAVATGRTSVPRKATSITSAGLGRDRAVP
jgi:hypothetical protein